MALTMEQLQVPAVGNGLITDQDYQTFKALFDDETFYWRMYLMTSAWAQKPK